MSRWLLSFSSLLSFASIIGAQAPRLRVPEGSVITYGMPSSVEIEKLGVGDTATLVAWRRMVVRSTGGKADTITLRASGAFVGVPGGRVRVDHVAPISGTWDRADPFALVWSMERRDTVYALSSGRIHLSLEQRGRELDSATLLIRASAPGVQSRWVEGAGFAGALAVPSSAGAHPVIILLHGSEGGDSVSARSLAASFASQGYAAFALTYFSWNSTNPGIPNSLVNVPVEMMDRARAWLGAQPGIDTSRTGLWGVSKGAELALVIASRRSWPRAVVACVPSDVVWSGFGRAPAEGEVMSSWSDGGVSLPFVAYDRYADAIEGRVTARIVHDRSRALSAATESSAMIPIARSTAPLLLLGAERDETWASAAMVRSLSDTLRAHGMATQVRTRTYSMAGHGICGVGANIAFQFERQYPTAMPPDARATAAAGADAWRETLAFFQDRLR